MDTFFATKKGGHHQDDTLVASFLSLTKNLYMSYL